MTNRKFTLKTAYLAAFLIILMMLFLQFIILSVNNSYEAKNTTKAYLLQLETILKKNAQEEEALLASLKEDYTVLAKAVSYYLDYQPDAADDIEALNKICSLMSIDEIHVFNDQGVITSSSLPGSVGLSFESGEQISYFLPMLSDKTLTMCQDVTPNTISGTPMVYAITWNEAGTQMVQVGIKPVRLLEALASNQIQSTINDIALDEKMTILVASADTYEIVAAKDINYLGKNITEVMDLDPDATGVSFMKKTRLADKGGYYYCRTGITEDYYICVLMSYAFFKVRTTESMLIVLIYLIAAYLVIVITIRKLHLTRVENDQHMRVFESMSEIYYSLHLVDLKKNTSIEYSSRNEVRDAFGGPKSNQADKTMIQIMNATMSDGYLKRGLEFADMTTVAERMRGKKSISMELLGRNVGWIRMSFVTFEEKDGLPEKIIIATQIIDEEKKLSESLFKKSHMDDLTGCFNRRAYNMDILDYENENTADFVYMAFDVNGLKPVNDNLGHEAGDELIKGVADCARHVFSKHGNIYRTGGDEFVGLISADKNLMEMLCQDFDDQIGSWHGKLVKDISVSYGYVLSSECPDQSVSEMASLADKRMYACKAEYYKKKGIEPRRS